MFNFGNYFWVFVSTLIFNLLGFIVNHVFRSNVDADGKNNSNSSDFCHEQDDQTLRHGSKYMNSYGFREKENSEFYFRFKFQFGEDFNTKIAETESSVLMENDLTMSTSKYIFESAKDIGGFMEEPEAGSFIVQELFVGSNEESIDNRQNLDPGVTIDKGFQELKFVEEVHELEEDSNFPAKDIDHCTEFQALSILGTGEKTEESVFGEEEVLAGKEGLNLGENEVSKKEQVNWLADNFLNTENFSYGYQFLSENELSPFDSNLESDNWSDGFSISPGEIDSGDHELFPDGDGDEELGSDIAIPDDRIKVRFIDEVSSLQEIDDGDNEDDFIVYEPNLDYSSELVKENKVLEDTGKFEEKEQVNEVEKTKKSWDFDSDEEDESDALLEHHDLIEQMKMELKNSRTGGLPTILEECETTKMAGDLKQLKIDEKIEHVDRMGEIKKFYKSYAEKMRKLDVLNYQTLQAIGFLQMRQHPVQLTAGENNPFSVVKSRLLPNFWPSKLRRVYADPTLKSISEMQRDLVVVYVGQVCLSWEILRWQHGKAKEFQEYDSDGLRSYNQVAGEFQQFQVLIQRFTEDEAFQGPRVQNYVKQRCNVRSLLQVPTIKDDCLKDKKGKRQEQEDAISMAMLAELIEESMRVFWVFLRADKDYANFVSKVLQGSHASLQDPADLELFTDIKTSLQKKEKRLKDILRTGNCLVKKFQKHQRASLDLPLFLSQVELRLVSRVLSLPRLTHDQLIWCQTKLNNINFFDRKIHIEPLFLLFPC